MKTKRNSILLVLVLAMASFQSDCSKGSSGGGGNTPAANDVEFWLTKSDKSVLFQKQSATISFGNSENNYTSIAIDSTIRFQTIEGFGYSLTGGSAELINSMNATAKAALLQELFGSNANSIGVSYLRISIGASDLNNAPFTYDDMPTGQTDLTLTNFSLNADKANGTGLIPLLKEILQINPNIKIMGSPWTAPVWMKDNNSTIGGSLQPQYYAVYAQYFVKYIQQMKAEGITIDAITPQNEPLYGGNNPSMLMTAAQQADFIKNHLGPAFQAAGITTKIIVYDHNCNRPDYPVEVLNDAGARQYVSGSAFHLYEGDISALSAVHNAYPDKGLYFTEQWTGANGSFDGDLKWHIKNVIIGSVNNWSKVALEWNLANDPTYHPHTLGGCSECKGAVTIAPSSEITRNVSYYIVAHASKFVPAGSIFISSNSTGSLSTAAFLRPDGKKVLLVLNEAVADRTFNIKFNNKFAATTLPAGSVGTYIW